MTGQIREQIRNISAGMAMAPEPKDGTMTCAIYRIVRALGRATVDDVLEYLPASKSVPAKYANINRQQLSAHISAAKTAGYFVIVETRSNGVCVYSIASLQEYGEVQKERMQKRKVEQRRRRQRAAYAAKKKAMKKKTAVERFKGSSGEPIPTKEELQREKQREYNRKYRAKHRAKINAAKRRAREAAKPDPTLSVADLARKAEQLHADSIAELGRRSAGKAQQAAIINNQFENDQRNKALVHAAYVGGGLFVIGCVVIAIAMVLS